MCNVRTGLAACQRTPLVPRGRRCQPRLPPGAVTRLRPCSPAAVLSTAAILHTSTANGWRCLTGAIVVSKPVTKSRFSRRRGRLQRRATLTLAVPAGYTAPDLRRRPAQRAARLTLAVIVSSGAGRLDGEERRAPSRQMERIP